jgi:ABC-type lipoprotein release transport system permease subunit
MTLVAVGLGLAVLIFTIGLDEGSTEGTLRNSIRLQTGHVQVRAVAYDEDKLSLEWEELLEDPYDLAGQAKALGGAQVAAPMLWAGSILGTRDEMASVRVFGIDPLSGASTPIRASAAAALALPSRSVLTWRDLNRALMQSMAQSAGMMDVMNFIVLAIVAVVITNTLLMSVPQATPRSSPSS